jgi:hypothetical protein
VPYSSHCRDTGLEKGEKDKDKDKEDKEDEEERKYLVFQHSTYRIEPSHQPALRAMT